MTTTEPTQEQPKLAAVSDPPAADTSNGGAQPLHEDPLAKLTYQDIPTFKEEVRGMKDVTPEQLQEIIHGTVMSLLRALGAEVYKLRAWNIHMREEDVGVMSEVIQRLEEVESLVYGGDSQLTQQDADLFANITGACEAFAEQAFEATQDAQGRRQLDELKDLCARGKARIDEIVMSDDDDDGDGDGDGDNDEG